MTMSDKEKNDHQNRSRHSIQEDDGWADVENGLKGLDITLADLKDPEEFNDDAEDADEQDQPGETGTETTASAGTSGNDRAAGGNADRRTSDTERAGRNRTSGKNSSAGENESKKNSAKNGSTGRNGGSKNGSPDRNSSAKNRGSDRNNRAGSSSEKRSEGSHKRSGSGSRKHSQEKRKAEVRRYISTIVILILVAVLLILIVKKVGSHKTGDASATAASVQETVSTASQSTSMENVVTSSSTGTDTSVTAATTPAIDISAIQLDQADTATADLVTAYFNNLLSTEANPAIEAYSQITTYVYPVDGGTVAFAEYTYKYRNFTENIPALTEFYIADGQIVDQTTADQDQQLTDAASSAEAATLISQVKSAYDSVIASDPALESYINSLSSDASAASGDTSSSSAASTSASTSASSSSTSASGAVG